MSFDYNTHCEKLDEYILNANVILLGTHISPDGDGIGSCMSFSYYLKSLKKDCKILTESTLPDSFLSFKDIGCVTKYKRSLDNWIEKVDLCIVFDIGDFNRLGDFKDKVYGKCKVVCIDHHPSKTTKTPYSFEFIDIEAPATGYMVWKYFQYKKLINPIDMQIAKWLYVSLISDTGSFKYQSTTSDTHRMAANLLESGLKTYPIHRILYEEQPISKIRLLSLVVQKMQLSSNNKIAWIVLTPNMISQANGTFQDVDGITEYLRTIENVEISFMIMQLSDGTFRVNFRSSGIYVINDVAQSLGGGGHKFAAGARIESMSLAEIKNHILEQMFKKIPGEAYGN